MTVEGATRSAFREAIAGKKFDVVHFIGHGRSDGILLRANRGQKGTVVPADARVQMINAAAEPPALVILSACETGKVEDIEPLGNVAELLVYSGTPVCSPDAKAQMVFTDPPYNVKIDGHVSGLGAAKHREFAFASGEMSEDEFTRFLARVLTNLADHAIDGAIHFVCMDWRRQARRRFARSRSAAMIPAPAGQARNTRSAVEGAGLVRPCIDGGLRFISRSDRWPVEAKSAVCITRILRNTLLDAHVISAKPRVSFIGGLSDSYHTAVTINGKMMRGAHCCQSVAVRWVNGLPSENTVANYPVK